MTTQKIAVIDYGMGNLHSVVSAIAKVAPQHQVVVTNDSSEIASADRVIFPGVGAIRDCMAEILRLGIDKILATEIASGKPVLAICVGMQALMEFSEENEGVDCLGHFKGKVKFFSDAQVFKDANAINSDTPRLKVPHMGWNQVELSRHPLWEKIENLSRFYFVHSYFVDIEEPAIETAKCRYGVDFTASIARENVFAVQFHPEKSHTNGLQLLKNFVDWKVS